MEIRAVGRRLESSQVLSAYRAGLFPMPVEDGLFAWYSPLNRGVLLPGDLHISHSLSRSRASFDIRVNTAFAQVLRACATSRNDGNWIDDDIIGVYMRLHEEGWAHSVEAWRGDELVGGLYGVGIGAFFAGESMFHTVTDASKAALAGLVDLCHEYYGDSWLIDTQWSTSHLESLGVSEIPAWEYRVRLQHVLADSGSRKFHIKG